MTYYDEMLFSKLPVEMRSAAVRRHLKLIWLEHVKRRPALIEEAKKEYLEVKHSLRRWGSIDNADLRLKRPFKGTDEDINKLTL